MSPCAVRRSKVRPQLAVPQVLLRMAKIHVKLVLIHAVLSTAQRLEDSMGGKVSGKFKVLHTVTDNKRLALVADQLGISDEGKKKLLEGATGRSWIIEEIGDEPPTVEPA
jgi:hypothetical protein